MRITYDTIADALYIYLHEGQPVARTEMIDGGTLVDLTDSGALIGIEVLSPARSWPLEEIVDRFDVELDATLALKALWGQKVYPYSHEPRVPQPV